MQDFVYHKQFEVEDNYWWFVARNNIVKFIINKFNKAKSDSYILDIGCGPGAMSKLISEERNIIGIDTSPLAVEYAQKRGLKNIFLSDLRDFNFSSYKIDSALMLDVIEHIENDKDIVSDVYKLLPTGSYFIATVPAYMWLWSIHDEFHMHYRRYNRKNFLKLLSDAGFKVEFISYFNTFLFPLAAIKRIFEKITGKKEVTDAIDNVSPLLNKIFAKIFLSEKFFLQFMKFPFGVSLIAVCRKM